MTDEKLKLDEGPESNERSMVDCEVGDGREAGVGRKAKASSADRDPEGNPQEALGKDHVWTQFINVRLIENTVLPAHLH